MTTTAGTTQDLELDLLAETARRLTTQRDAALDRVTEYGDAIAYLELAASAGGLVQIRRPGAATLLTTRVAGAAVDVLIAAPTLVECVERTRRVQVVAREGGSHRAAEAGEAATTPTTTAGARAETQTCRQHPFPAPSVATPAPADAGGDAGTAKRQDLNTRHIPPTDAGGEVDALSQHPVAVLSRYAGHLADCASHADAEEIACSCGYVGAWNAVFSRPAQAREAGEAEGSLAVALVKLVRAARNEERQRQRGSDKVYYKAGDELDTARAAVERIFAAQTCETERLKEWKAYALHCERVLADLRTVAADLYVASDADRHSRVAKLAVALDGGLPGYDKRVDAFRDVFSFAPPRGVAAETEGGR